MNPSYRLMIAAVLLIMLVGFLFVRPFSVAFTMDSFTDSMEPSKEDLEKANEQYAGLLLFLQRFPSRSIPFIKDIQSKLFDSSCTVKPSIDFGSIATFPNGMVFV